MHGLSNLHRVTGIDDCNAGNGPYDSDIVELLMGSTEIGVCYAGTAANHLDILIHITQLISKHLKGSGSNKGGD
jgi:hypothetical protein